jgi:hypothetical protein
MQPDPNDPMAFSRTQNECRCPRHKSSPGIQHQQRWAIYLVLCNLHQFWLYLSLNPALNFGAPYKEIDVPAMHHSNPSLSTTGNP